MDNIALALIVCTDNKNGISKNGIIPWKLQEDTNFFQDVTKREYIKGKKNVLIMGRNTYEYCKNIKDRLIVVVSSQEDLDCEIRCKSLDKAIKCAKSMDVGKIFICGGKRIYEEAVNWSRNISDIYLTRIHDDYQCDNVLDSNFFLYSLCFGGGRTTRFEINGTFVDFCKYSDYELLITWETDYLNLLEKILKEGHFRQTRNAKTWSLFGETLTFNLEDGFPLLTTKKVFFRGVVEELLFFLKGDTNAKHLSEKGVKIWDLNTSKEFISSQGLDYQEGDMGPMYGFNLVHFGAHYEGMDKKYEGYNQIEYCLNLLKTDPFSRRIIMTTYNPAQAHLGVLYPCHGLSIMFNVDKNWRLSCMMFQRSADACCGIPFNIASYALLVHLFCEVINNDPNYTGNKFTPGKLIMNFGDVHIYEEHYQGAVRQILREPYPFPTLKINKVVKELIDYKFEDFELIGYESYPSINFKMIA